MMTCAIPILRCTRTNVRRHYRIIILVLSLLTVIGLALQLRATMQEGGAFEEMIFAELELTGFAYSYSSQFEDTFPQSSWPQYQGYNNKYVNAMDNPIDELLYERIAFAQTKQRIPLIRLRNQSRHEWKFEKIIHQTWIDANIPKQTASWVKTWLEKNPDWTYMFWSDDSARQFVKLHVPMLLSAYDSWTVPVQRADMFRYIVLYVMGGVYADIDMEALRPLNELRQWSSCILSREPEVQTYVMSNFMNCWGNNWTFTCNAFMACRAHHPFLHYLIARTVQNSPLITKQECIKHRTLLCTGPWMMSFSYAFYRRSIPESLRRKLAEVDVICPESGWFLPTFDDSRLGIVKSKCASYFLNQLQNEICESHRARKFVNQPLGHSYTTHHWLHSYDQNINIDRVDIRTVTEPLFWTPENQSRFVV